MKHLQLVSQIAAKIRGSTLVIIATQLIIFTMSTFDSRISALENGRLSGSQIIEPTAIIPTVGGGSNGGDIHKKPKSWDYGNQNDWAGDYPQCNGSKMRQSPIDIKTDNVTFQSQFKLEFIDYNQEVEFEVKNTHHSASFKPIPAISTPMIRINWLPKDSGEFELQEIHFHWGNGLDRGSEHEINDQKAAAEMHMVHYRKGINRADIGATDNSVVVVCVLIESDLELSHRLDSLVKKAERINGTDLEFIDDNPENLIDLLPENHHTFYTYNGSLTTPPCYEVVTWVILSEPVYMAQDKLVELSNLEAMNPVNGRQKIAPNHRDIQPLFDRPVYASFNASQLTTNKLQQSSRYFSGQNFRKAFTEYWRVVNDIQTSIKQALKSIKTARLRLRQRLDSLMGRDATGNKTTTSGVGGNDPI